MASNGKARVRVTGRFHPGAKVSLIPRTSDVFNPAFFRQAVASATVKKDNTLEFDGLNPGDRYWVAAEIDGEVRHASATAKEAPAGKPKGQGPLPHGSFSEGLGRHRNITTGARNSTNLRIEAVRKASALPHAHEPTPKGEMPDEPQPHPKQADVSGPQRSDTPMGEAHPVEPGEPQPRLRQDQIKAGTPQRSDTPLGEATPKDPTEQVPGARQEDTSGVKQRSDTPHGTAEPKPKTRSPREQEKAKDSAESKAKGATVAKAGTAKRKKAAPRKTKASAPVKKGAGDKGKAARSGGADSAPDPDKATTEKKGR